MANIFRCPQDQSAKQVTGGLARQPLLSFSHTTAKNASCALRNYVQVIDIFTILCYFITTNITEVIKYREGDAK